MERLHPDSSTNIPWDDCSSSALTSLTSTINGRPIREHTAFSAGPMLSKPAFTTSRIACKRLPASSAAPDQRTEEFSRLLVAAPHPPSLITSSATNHLRSAAPNLV